MSVERSKFIADLRTIASIYEADADELLPHPYGGGKFSVFCDHRPEAAKIQVRVFVAAVGGLYKKDDGDYMKLVADAVPLVMYVQKESLGCQKVVVPRTVMETKWACGPILDAIKEKEPTDVSK